MADTANFFKTAFYTWEIIPFKTLESTNKLLSENLTQYKPFTCIWADKQNNGRGRFDRTWDSVAGKDLTFSLLVPLINIPQKYWNNITQTIAVAIVKTIEEMQITSQIKWPNDVLINGKKLCGILCKICSFSKQQQQNQKQNQQHNNSHMAIVGIGINVNSDEKDMTHINQKTTSLFLESQKQHNREHILKDILIHVSECLNYLEHDNFDYVRKCMCCHLTLQGKRVILKVGLKTHKGIIVGINDDGTLCFKCDNCGSMKVHSGELLPM